MQLPNIFGTLVVMSESLSNSFLKISGDKLLIKTRLHKKKTLAMSMRNSLLPPDLVEGI